MEKKPNAGPSALMAIALLALSRALFPTAGRAASCPKPDATAAEAFVRSLHDGARKILLTEKNPVRPMAAFISQNVEIERVARSAMGPAWNTATPAQRSEYLKLFRTTTLKTLAEHITLYEGAAYKIVQARPLDDDEFLVTSMIVPRGGLPFRLAWRINADGCRLTASDVVNSGVSLVVTKRQEFASVIGREGVDGLVERLRDLAANQVKGTADGSDSGEEVLVDLVLRAAEKLGTSRY